MLHLIRKLTLKQRKFWKDYCIHHNLAHAAKHAGSKGKDVKSLSAIGYQILESLQLSMPELLNVEGLTDKVMAEKLIEGLNADRVQLASFEGKFRDQKTFKDIPTRMKALELMGRMKGVFIDRHELTGANQGDILLQINPSKARRGPKRLNLDID